MMRPIQIARSALVACALFAPGSAHAFSDPTMFDKLPLAAGGGGRFFTGSPADGYTCKVCHTGGSEPKLNVTGLPLGGYKPGVRYEVVVNWPSTLDKMSLALELTDQKGKLAGSLQLPPEGEIQSPEFCDPAADMILAASITETTSRQLINVPDCGSKRLRFLWTAPTTDVGPVWFSGAAVHSDGEGDTKNDGVTDFGRVIDSPAIASTTSAQCSVRAPGKHGDRAFAAALALLAGLLWVRRSRRR